MPRLRIVAGPNGSGKSTLINTLRDYPLPLGMILNADELEKNLRENIQIETTVLNIFKQEGIDLKQKWEAYWSDSSYAQKFNDFLSSHIVEDYTIHTGFFSYLSAAIIEFQRQNLLEIGKDITFETVFSHKSKLDFLNEAKEKGYKVYLYFVCLESYELNMERVSDRVVLGGHSVLASRIKERYARSLENLLPAFEIADNAYLFDNSGALNLFLKKENDVVSKIAGMPTPMWANPLLKSLSLEDA